MYLNLIENIMNFVINTKNKVLDQTYKSRTSIFTAPKERPYKSRTSIYLFIIRPLKAVLYIIINE